MAHTEQIIFVFSFLVFISPRTSVEHLLLRLNSGSYCFGNGEEKEKTNGVNLLLQEPRMVTRELRP
jgi:hypothetical protein